MNYTFFYMQVSQAVGNSSHNFDKAPFMQMTDFPIKAALGTKISDDHEILLLLIEKKLSSPKQILMLHGSQQNAFLAYLLFILLIDFNHLQCVLFLIQPLNMINLRECSLPDDINNPIVIDPFLHQIQYLVNIYWGRDSFSYLIQIMNKVQKWSEQIPKPQPPNFNIIYSCTFNTDGSLLFVAISDILVVYNSETGEVVTKPTRAAKQPINCIAFAKDGKTFATASNDRTCIIWKYNPDSQKKIQPVLKLTQNDAILTLAFNPLTYELFSGGASDFALFIPGKKEIPKQKFKEKIISSGWSADGQTLAFGSINGTLSFRQRNLDQKNQIKLNAAIWCMEWSPITTEHQTSYLLVGCWDQTFYYFDSEGQRRQKFSERHIPCNPISVNFHHTGEYFVMTGTDKKVSLYSRDLGYLTELSTLNDWSWCTRFKPKSQQLALTTNSGWISVQQLAKKNVFSSYRELYAKRDNFTDVIIENIAMNQKLKVKCKELVKKISIFKDKLAVLQNQRLLIYVAGQQGLKYSPYRKITKRFQCDSMEILNSHALFASDNRIQVYNFLGQLEREWILDAKVTYLRTIGGPPKREHALVGLANGQVLKLFVDNSFPIQLYQSTVAILKCELNVSKKKLAILDLNKNLVGIDLISQSQLFQEVNVNSFAWNSDLEDSIAFASGGTISIKTGNLHALTQKSDANIIGFEGFQLFINKNDIITVMDISQSSTLVKYIEKKEYSMAYKLACLGVPDNDLRFLGMEALQNQDFQVAEKCFVRLKDLAFAQLTKKYAEELKKTGKINIDALKAQVLSYQGKYQEAASLYVKAGKLSQAIELFCELKKFDEALRYVRMGNQNQSDKQLLGRIYEDQAEWARANGDWKLCGSLLTTSKNYKKAIDLYQKENYMEGLIEVCRIIDKESNQLLLTNCAALFKKNKEHGYAKQIFLKLGDMKSLMTLHVEMQKWEQAFLLGKQNRQLLEMAKIPYANFLLKNDRYEEALRAFRKINRPDLTHKIIDAFSKNAVSQRRYLEAARQYWSLAAEQLKAVKDVKNPSEADQLKLKRYGNFRQISQVYFVYNSVAQFVETPFFTSSDAALYTILNACRFLITKISHLKLPQINASYVYYSLAKVSAKLEGYKTARACYDKLSHLVVNNKWAQQMELGSLTVRSKPFSDKDTILPTCARCSMANPIISDKNCCFNCRHPFILSFMSYQVLPLIQFKPAPGITHSKFLDLLSSEKKDSKKKSKGDGWNQQIGTNQQVLSFGGLVGGFNKAVKDKISQNLEIQQIQTEFTPTILSEQEISQLEYESVYFIDQRKINSGLSIRYFINIAPEILLKNCGQCGKFFLLDEYEFQFVQTKRCPFCNGEEKRSGRTKDIFDL